MAIATPGQFYFALPERIAPSLDKLFAELNREGNLAGAALTEFCNRAGYFLGELNAIHPFRDGNGRSQRELIRQLAVHNGFQVDWSRISREQMGEAPVRSFQRADNSGLVRLLEICAGAESR